MSGDNEQTKRVAEIRRDYSRKELIASKLSDNPIAQFMDWFKEAVSADLLDPNAMTLSTATKDGVPSSRIVLLKGVDEEGFRFYTNYESRKAKELDENPRAALCFYWSNLERQVRIEGTVEKLTKAESQKYFEQRPRLSQLSAWASQQSSIVQSRKEIEADFQDITKRFEGENVPIPKFWGGYILKPEAIEFWQGRESRLHDRFRYEKRDNEWIKFRLAP